MRRSDAKRWSCWRSDAAGILFCIGISLVAYLAVLRPLMRQRTAVAQQWDELEVQRRKASQLEAVDSAHKKHLAAVRQSLTESGIILRPAGYINRQIAALTKLSNNCGLTVDDIQVGKIHRGTRYNIVPISLSGRGDYKKCAAFLRELSEAFPDTGAACFEMSGTPKQPDQDGQFRFDLFWYAAPRVGSPRN